MKCLLALACLLYAYKPDPSLLVLDKDLKKPVHTANRFTATQYLQHCFPVYAAETSDIIAATDNVVKKLDDEPACHRMDTITAAHTTFLLIQDCDPTPAVSVILMTTVEESQTTFGFTVVSKEENRRKAQQKLLDFAAYLDQ